MATELLLQDFSYTKKNQKNINVEQTVLICTQDYEVHASNHSMSAAICLIIHNCNTWFGVQLLMNSKHYDQVKETSCTASYIVKYITALLHLLRMYANKGLSCMNCNLQNKKRNVCMSERMYECNLTVLAAFTISILAPKTDAINVPFTFSSPE